MRAKLMFGAGDVGVKDVPDARLIDFTDALVLPVDQTAPTYPPPERCGLHRRTE